MINRRNFLWSMASLAAIGQAQTSAQADIFQAAGVELGPKQYAPPYHC